MQNLAQSLSCTSRYRSFLLVGEPILTEQDIKHFEVVSEIDPAFGAYIALTLKEKAVMQYRWPSSQLIQQRQAIVLNGKAIKTSSLMMEIASGHLAVPTLGVALEKQ